MRGGQDNTIALANALQQLEHYQNAELLWIHSPQPIIFDETSALLEQTITRLSELPRISLYSLQFGPNKVVNNTKLELISRTLPRSSSISKDLKHYFHSLLTTTKQHHFQRSTATNQLSAPNGSKHISRLWARDKIRSLLISGDKKGALETAAKFQLVTAISGAVVLENQQQYDDNNLQPVDSSSVPAIPEPHQLLIVFIASGFLLWCARRKRLMPARRRG